MFVSLTSYVLWPKWSCLVNSDHIFSLFVTREYFTCCSRSNSWTSICLCIWRRRWSRRRTNHALSKSCHQPDRCILVKRSTSRSSSCQLKRYLMDTYAFFSKVFFSKVQYFFIHCMNICSMTSYILKSFFRLFMMLLYNKTQSLKKSSFKILSLFSWRNWYYWGKLRWGKVTEFFTFDEIFSRQELLRCIVVVVFIL